ncbi:MAG: pyruvate kinase [Chloroflexi bacterium]|nr:pyruvate kinase [Chloroflexota bacterium]
MILVRYTKIVCTIGPASQSPATLRQMITDGMDVARINFSHGDHSSHSQIIQRLRTLADEEQRPIAILGDLQGPKLRVGDLPAGGIQLTPGTEIYFASKQPREGDIPCQYADLPRLVHPGDHMLLDDGLLEVEVLATSDDRIRARVLTGGRLYAHKGINLPQTDSSISAITAKDRADLQFAIDHELDWIALSFVRSAAEIHELHRLIEEATPRRSRPLVIAKIEKPEAVNQIEAIIAASDGLMVARGDLGIELPTEDVPMIQKQIIRLCNQTGKPVITATQMLDSMIRNPRPTRAEASDVANAVLDGTDAVMLSGETAVGKYPLRAVVMMDRIIRKAEQASPSLPVRIHAHEHIPETAQAIAHAASDLATHLNATAIIAPTASGYTARQVARYRPHLPIIAVTPHAQIQRQLNLLWGVIPLRSPRQQTTDAVIADAVEAARQGGCVQTGDLVIVTAGSASSAPGTTDLIKIQHV